MTDTGVLGAGGSGAGGSGAEGSGDGVRESVRVGYAAIARSGQWSGVGPGAEPSEGVASLGGLEIVSGSGCCGGGAEDQVGDGGGGGCCGPTTLTADQVAVAVGYGESDLAGLPAGSNMGLSCGNPTALASLEPGEVVVDLGSGGGFDCFIAGPRVGAAGRVIGVDMTPEMLSKARSNVSAYRERTGLDNVEFRLGEIENLPVADGSADVVISNCVLNLSPEKRRVWREIARVLRVGGRAAVSDLALVRPLPAAVVADVEALVGCVAGAVLVDEVRSAAEAAGLERIEIVAKPEYVEAMTSFEDPLYRKIASSLGDGERVSDYVVSVDVSAVKAG